MLSRGCGFLLLVALLISAACERATPIADVRTSVAARGSDSTVVTARWTSSDTGVVFLWRTASAEGGEAFVRADTADQREASFELELPAADVPSEFCVRSLRLADGAQSREACAEFVLSASPPPLPDSSQIHLALVHETLQYRNPSCVETTEVCRRRDDAGNCTRRRSVCARVEPKDTLSCLTLRWDSVPGATGFATELSRNGRLLSSGNVNDDSCPACDDLRLEGHRWACFGHQEGCRFNLWPYFTTGWCVARESGSHTLTATVIPLRGEAPIAPSETVEWEVLGR